MSSDRRFCSSLEIGKEAEPEGSVAAAAGGPMARRRSGSGATVTSNRSTNFWPKLRGRRSIFVRAPPSPAKIVQLMVDPLNRGASVAGIRGAREPDGARKGRRNDLKRLDPRPEMVWSRKPRSHNIWYTGARLTVRSD